MTGRSLRKSPEPEKERRRKTIAKAKTCPWCGLPIMPHEMTVWSLDGTVHRYCADVRRESS